MTDLSIDPKRFETPYETALYERFNAIKTDDYAQLLEALAALRPELDAFFEHVMVNAEDEAVKQNRKSLIAAIYLSFKTVADIKEITAA